MKGKYAFMECCTLSHTHFFLSSISTCNQEIKCQILQQIKDTPCIDYTEEEIKGEKDNLFIIHMLILLSLLSSCYKA